MVIQSSPAETSRLLREVRLQGQKIGFVPTMGYLHSGHLSLVELARERAEYIVASIFVNPTQFNDSRDLEQYPRDLERDCKLLREAGVDAVFTPSPAQMYPSNFQSTVSLSRLTVPYEGAPRPGHFDGVTTVVALLFNIVQPDLAVFGEKDFQQLRVIEQMVSDLHMPIEIVRGRLVREADGLAMSSRNVLLSEADRKSALSISRGLFAALRAFEAGEYSRDRLLGILEEELSAAAGIEPEYLELVGESDLAPVEKAGEQVARLLVAARVGKVRLIDNISLSVV